MSQIFSIFIPIKVKRHVQSGNRKNISFGRTSEAPRGIIGALDRQLFRYEFQGKINAS